MHNLLVIIIKAKIHLPRENLSILLGLLQKYLKFLHFPIF